MADNEKIEETPVGEKYPIDHSESNSATGKY